MRAQLLNRLANRTALEVIPASLALEGEGTPIPLETKAVVAAAVLVPLVERPEGMTVLLTRRAEHLNDHPGQISFPGGRIEAYDKDVIDAALRETEEEIGLDRSHIEVVGCLDDCLTGIRKPTGEVLSAHHVCVHRRRNLPRCKRAEVKGGPP